MLWFAYELSAQLVLIVLSQFFIVMFAIHFFFCYQVFSKFAARVPEILEEVGAETQ